MEKTISTLLVMVSLLLGGCGLNKVNVALNSLPQGAEIYYEGKPWGRTPLQAWWNVTPAHRAAGFVSTSPLEVRWISGASKSEPLTIWLSNGSYQTYTFARPRDFADYEKDARFGLEVEKMSNQLRAQQLAQESQNALILSNAINSSATTAFSTPRINQITPHSAVQVYQPPTKIDCTTREFANTLHTECK